MKKLLCIAFYFVPVIVFAQNLHISVRAGLFNYNGELQSSAFTLKQAKPGFGIGVRQDLTEHFSARFHVQYASLQGDDKKGTAAMQQRNLNFKTKLLEAELGVQYNIINLNDNWFSPYIFIGGGVMKYNPYTYTSSNQKVYLQPLSTEGQGIIAGTRPYKLFQFQLPMAVGGEYALNEDMRLGLEFGYRKTFTDHLDDVSTFYVDQATLQNARGPVAVELAYRGDEVGAGTYPTTKVARGNSGNKDAYYYMALTFTWRLELDTYKRIAGLPVIRKEKKVGCPSVRY
jgi:Domain of unknown function (DUF6089)